jgi:hypothetical protein
MCKEWLSIIPSAILGVAAVGATIWFSRSNKKREEDKMLKELFTEFNSRYAKINKSLSDIVESDKSVTTIDKLSKKQKAIIIEFFNICAEEYFWHQKGRIDDSIWDSWQAGMNYWYNHTNPIIKDMWQKECLYEGGKTSYYIKNGNEFFK